MTETDQRPGVDERYMTAMNARTLEVSPHHAGPADVLAAAAWSNSRVGSLLLRLHSEFDAADRLASLAEMRVTLRTLPQAVEQVAHHATRKGLQDAPERARRAILWWLDHRCPACHGRRWKVVPGAPALSSVVCPCCRGSGEVSIPDGQDGRMLVGHIEDCVSRARASIKDRLRGKR